MCSLDRYYHTRYRKGGKPKNPDADLDRELDHFDVTESDDGLDADDRILIDNARGRRINDEEVCNKNRAN